MTCSFPGTSRHDTTQGQDTTRRDRSTDSIRTNRSPRPKNEANAKKQKRRLCYRYNRRSLCYHQVIEPRHHKHKQQQVGALDHNGYHQKLLQLPPATATNSHHIPRSKHFTKRGPQNYPRPVPSQPRDGNNATAVCLHQWSGEGVPSDLKAHNIEAWLRQAHETE